MNRFKSVCFICAVLVAALTLATAAEALKTDSNSGRLAGTLDSKTVTTFPNGTARVDLMVGSGGEEIPVFCGTSLASTCAKGAVGHQVDFTTSIRPTGDSRVASILFIVLED